MTSKEALEIIRSVDESISVEQTINECCDIVEKDLEILEKQDKILDIIFKKNVDIELLKLSTNWLDYYTRVKHRTGKNTELTEEELVLLKGWLDEKDK